MDRRSYGFFEIRRLKLKLNERIKNISKLLVFYRSRILLDYKSFQTKAYLRQKNIADFIKKCRTIKLLHILRNYSALAVVISSTILVVATNAATNRKSGDFLFGFKNEEEDQVAMKGNFGSQLEQKANLAFAPLAKASSVVDLQAKEKEEEDESLTIIQGQALAANNNPHFDDPQDEGEVKIYTVKDGDTVSSIALKNDITVNTILWANDIENIDSIKPGDQIFILPVAGVTHIVKSGDTIDSIASKYKADKDKIIAFNTLPANGKVEEGQQIVIPGGEKAIPAPSTPAASNLLNRQYASSTGGAPAVSGWKKLEGKAGNGHRFPYGYCTWYVAQRRFVPWAGNAGTWLYQAKILGYKTGKTPQKGSILVTSESRWGHVAVVESISGGTVTVSEMNYRGWGKVDKRVIALSSRIIKGFIY